jgi:purine-binding chemotaxis protein CheW
MIQPNSNADPPELARGRQTVILVRLDGQRYALPLDSVIRVLRAVAVTPVPELPPFVLGLINLAGRLVTVVSLRCCLGGPGRGVRPEDQLVVVKTPRLTLAVVVDEVQELTTLDESQTVAVGPALREEGCRAHGLVKLHGEIILIYELDQLISQAEQEHIRQVTEAAQAHV